MTIIFHIIHFKLRSLVKQSADFKTANIFRNVASLMVFGGFALGIYYMTRVSTDYLLDTAKLGSFLLHRFLSMLLFVYFLSISVGNIVVSYATFYRSQEVMFYLTKPVSHTQLFLIKFLDNFFYSSTAFFLLAFAALCGYGSHFHLKWTFYFNTMFFLLLPYMLSAGCLAVILLLLLMRYAAAIGMRKMIVLISGMYVGLTFLYFSLTSPLKLVARVLQHYPNLDQYFGYLDPPVTKYLPNYWIAESLFWLVRGEKSYSLSYTIMIILFSGLTFTLMYFTGKKLFYKTWIASLDMRGDAGKGNRFSNIITLNKSSFRDTQSDVLFKKEIIQFLREPSQWIHLGIISMLVIMFIFSIANINLKQNMPFLQTISYITVLLFNAFLIASVSLRFVYPSYGIEGTNLWSVLSAPVKRNKIFWIKYFIWFVPMIVLSELLAVFSHRSLMDYPALLISAVVIMFGVAVAFVGLNLSVGFYFADFREKNPIRIASSQSATVTFLICIGYLTILVAIMFIPFFNYFNFMLKNVSIDPSQLLYAAGIMLLVSLLVGMVSVAAGLKSLKRDF